MSIAPANTLFDEILDFLVSRPTPEQIIGFMPPAYLQERLSQLLEQNRQHGLSLAEQTELNEFFQLDRFMSRLKIRARKQLTNL